MTDYVRLEARIRTICLLVLALVAAGMAAYWLRNVMVPFVLAVFLASVMSPVIDWFTLRWNLPRPLSVSLTLALSLVVLFLLASVVTTSVTELTEQSQTYVARFRYVLDQAIDRLPFAKERQDEMLERLTSEFTASIGSVLAATTNGIFFLLSQLTVVLLSLVFILFGGATRTDPLPGVWGDIDRQVKSYIATKTVLSVITGVLVGSVLMIFNIDLAIVFGLFAFLLNFIPNIGSIISTLLPLPLVIFTPGVSPSVAAAAILIPGLIHFTIGNVVEPKVMGDSLELHPVIILFALTVWGAIWGGIGMLLATPITAIFKILCERLEFTRPIAYALAGDFAPLMGQPARKPLVLTEASKQAMSDQVPAIGHHEEQELEGQRDGAGRDHEHTQSHQDAGHHQIDGHETEED
ncbi:MAG: AI-2E family transporter [Candidatus Eremiobacteraeota bacterium]|nr:AI-2E family transporter [Candidatus Eremiobacteraeota bacterium]